MGFCWSYTLLLEPPVLICSCPTLYTAFPIYTTTQAINTGNQGSYEALGEDWC